MAKFDNIKSMMNDDKLKKKIFLIFYGVFFLVFFLIFALTPTPEKENKDNNTILERKKDIMDNYNNYSFSHTINFNGEEILLYGSVYNNETLIHKKINDVEEVFYKYYDEIYKLNSNNKYSRYEGNIIDNFDLKLINPEYLEDILKDSLEQSKPENEVKYFNSNANIMFTFNYNSINELQNILVTKGDINIESKYYNEGNIDKFNVDIEK